MHKLGVYFFFLDSISSKCVYTICKYNPTVTLLRLDFATFDISQPFVCGGSNAEVTCSIYDGPKFGDCVYDVFTVSSPGNPAPPAICGYNTGQHMYVDSSDLCNKITFTLDTEVGFARKWDIKVTQYDEMDDARYLPPPGCLQWFTGSLGKVSNFNYRNTASYHLSSQRYSICWRRERNKCGLCFSIGIFGMSNVPSQVPPPSTTTWTKKAGFSDSICCEKDTPVANCGTSGANDYLEIDNAMERPISAKIYTTGEGNRFCGRWFGISSTGPSYTYSASKAARTICTGVIPFRIRVRFSDGEKLSSSASTLCSTSATARTSDTSDECATFRTYGSRRGTIGFSLVWWQTSCS